MAKTNNLNLNVELKIKYELNGADPKALRQRLDTALETLGGQLFDKRTKTTVDIKYKVARAMKKHETKTADANEIKEIGQ